MASQHLCDGWDGCWMPWWVLRKGEAWIKALVPHVASRTSFRPERGLILATHSNTFSFMRSDWLSRTSSFEEVCTLPTPVNAKEDGRGAALTARTHPLTPCLRKSVLGFACLRLPRAWPRAGCWQHSRRRHRGRRNLGYCHIQRVQMDRIAGCGADIRSLHAVSLLSS
jgi:hypothetical protein